MQWKCLICESTLILERDSATAHLRLHAITTSEYEKQHGAPLVVTSEDSPATAQSATPSVQSIPVDVPNSSETESVQKSDTGHPGISGDTGSPLIRVKLEIITQHSPSCTGTVNANIIPTIFGCFYVTAILS